MTMLELKRFASEEQMIPDAAVQDTQTVTINAPMEKVWRTQTDVDHWASWYSYLRNAKLSGPFGPGAELTYGGFPKHNLVIGKVEKQHLVMIYGKLMGFSAVTKWEFNSVSPTRTQVTFSESSVGFLLSVLYSKKKLGEHLVRWLEKLKSRAETI